MDQLRQILDRINVVMRRRRNQANARSSVTRLRNPGINFRARQLSALTRLRPLGHLNLNFFGINEIFAGDAKATRCHLLDRGIFGVSVW